MTDLYKSILASHVMLASCLIMRLNVVVFMLVVSEDAAGSTYPTTLLTSPV